MEIMNWFFVDEGADVFLKTKNGRKCLHFAAINGHLNFRKALANKHEFDVDITDDDGYTAVHFSARNGCYGLVKFFAEKDTNISSQNKTWKELRSYCSRYASFEPL